MHTEVPNSMEDKKARPDTAAAKPKVQYFPDVRVNGKQLQQATAKALVKAICQAYKGAKPSGCN